MMSFLVQNIGELTSKAKLHFVIWKKHFYYLKFTKNHTVREANKIWLSLSALSIPRIAVEIIFSVKRFCMWMTSRPRYEGDCPADWTRVRKRSIPDNIHLNNLK